MSYTPIIRLSPAPNTTMTPSQAIYSAMADDENSPFQDVLIIAYDDE